jgi:hypothetical protein
MHRAGMNPAQRDRHPPDLDRQRIAREEHAAIGQLDLRPGIKPQRAQALRFLGDKRGPVDRSDSGLVAHGEFIERHKFPLP